MSSPDGMRWGDRYVSLVQCCMCDARRVEEAIWGPTWEVENCKKCGHRCHTVPDPTREGFAVWARHGVMIVWTEMAGE